MCVGMGRATNTAATIEDEEVKVHTEEEQGSTIIVRGKEWEVMEIAASGMVQLKLVGGTLKKKFPLEQVKEALHNGGHMQ